MCFNVWHHQTHVFLKAVYVSLRPEEPMIRSSHGILTMHFLRFSEDMMLCGVSVGLFKPHYLELYERTIRSLRKSALNMCLFTSQSSFQKNNWPLRSRFGVKLQNKC